MRPTSSTALNAVITTEIGATTHNSTDESTGESTGESTPESTPSSRHTVFIDIESLPTGIDTPSGRQTSSLTLLTVSYKSASCPGSPAATIQLADKRTRLRSSIEAALRFVIASPIAIRPLAGASKTATGARSPMANASP